MDPDALLDRFMPVYDVVERHQIAVNAPPDVTLAAAKSKDLQQSPINHQGDLQGARDRARLPAGRNAT